MVNVSAICIMGVRGAGEQVFILPLPVGIIALIYSIYGGWGLKYKSYNILTSPICEFAY